MNEANHIGKKLQSQAERMGMKPAEVAKAFGVKPPSVYDWYAHGRIHKRHYPVLVNTFGQPLEWWLDFSPIEARATASMKTVAERLKDARTVRGWTQSHLATAAGVATGTVGNIESAIRQSPGSLPKLATALKVSHDWLAYGKGDMLVALDVSEHAQFSTAALEIAALFDMIPQSSKIMRAQVQVVVTKAILDALTGENK